MTYMSTVYINNIILSYRHNLTYLSTPHLTKLGVHVLGQPRGAVRGLPDACWLAYGVYMHAMEWR